MKTRLYWLLTIAAMMGVIACGPDPSGDDDDDNIPIDNFEQIQLQILTPSCTFSSCHGAALPAGSLSLLEGDSCDALINVPSTQVSLDRVEPGDPSTSFLYQKMVGPVAFGTLMPPPNGGMSQEKIDALFDWITDGAVCP